LDQLSVGVTPTGAAFIRAIANVLNAVDYQDPALMRSYIEESKAACAEMFFESVADQVKRSSAALEFVHELTDQFEGLPVELDEQSDDLGRSVSDLATTTLGAMTEFRNGPLAGVQKHGVDVPNAAKLDEHIAYWEAVKANLVDTWPWTTSAELPPVDRETVAKSRAAFQAGEQAEDIDTLIERLRGE
jgi:hypothetical protein